LRASIADADFSGLHAPISAGEQLRIGESIRDACFPVDAQSPEALLERPIGQCITAIVRGDGAAEERILFGERSRKCGVIVILRE
jgi:hypothetical protein